MAAATLSLISNDALSIAAKKTIPWDCPFCGGDAADCFCGPEGFSSDPDDDRTQGDDGDYGPFEAALQVFASEDPGKDSDDPTDDRSGGNGGMLRAYLERCLSASFSVSLVSQEDPDTDTSYVMSYVMSLGCNCGGGCIYCS